MNKIINILKQKKTLPIDQFIDLSLYDKKSGYYMKSNPFGKEGDYVTSPLISNLFGDMIGVWCVAFWEHLGKPKKISLVELGPGDGTLCKNLLNVFKKFKNFYNCFEINLLEKSNYLKKKQKKEIKNKKVKWIKNINKLNAGPIIFLGNEFFDALPIKQIYRKENIFFEKHIALEKKNKKLKFIYKKAKYNLIKNIKKYNLISKGNTIEYPVKAIEYLKLISDKISKYNGGLLILDYGYIKSINKNTLQSVKKHKFSNILLEPGNADITSHVNYKLFLDILKKNNLQVQKIVTQSEFLQKLGIIKRAEIISKDMSFREKAVIFYEIKRLLHYKEMGSLFKVLFAQNKKNRFNLGF